MTFSTSSIAQLQALDDGQGFLLLMEIDTASFTEPIRIVRDTDPLTIGAATYVPLPFDITLPQDAADESPEAQIELDNVGRDVLSELENLPVGAMLDVTLRIVSRATPTVVDWEFTATMSRASVNYGTISIKVGDDDIFRRPCVSKRYDPQSTPGLF